MAHEAGRGEGSTTKLVAALLQENALHSQHAASMRAMDQHYTALYDSVVSISRSMGLGASSVLNLTDGDIQSSRCSGEILFRVRCEEESRQMEAQRSFLLESLEQKQLECERLRAEGRALRAEIEQVFHPVEAFNRGVLLCLPSEGESLLARRSLGIRAATETEAPIVTLASALAALEERIRGREQDVLTKGKRVLAERGMHQETLQTLYDELEDAKQALGRDVVSLATAEAMVLIAEENKERLLLELEEMAQAEQRDELFTLQLTKLHEAFTWGAEKARRRRETLRRLLLEEVQDAQRADWEINTKCKPNNDANDDDNNSDDTNENEEEKDYRLALQISVQNALDVHRSLVILNAHTVSLPANMEEIETILKGLKSHSGQLPWLTDTRHEDDSWRSGVLQEAYNEAMHTLQQMQGACNVESAVLADLLRKLRRLSVIHNAFLLHPEALAGALMNSFMSWRDVHSMLQAASSSSAQAAVQRR